MDNITITGNRGSGGTSRSGIVAQDSNNVFIATDPSAGPVTVQNNGQKGIIFNNVTDGLINNTCVTNNGNGGVNLTSSQGITLQNVTANANAGYGFYLNNSDPNILIDNTAKGNYGANGGAGIPGGMAMDSTSIIRTTII